jgi:hypothetical protein
MAKDCAARPASAMELARMIREAAATATAGHGVQAVGQAADGRQPRKLPRITAQAAVTAALALVLVVSGALMVVRNQSASDGGRFQEIEDLLAAGRVSDAEDAIAARLRTSPDDADLLLLRGHVRAARGDEAVARSAYAAALKARPELASNATLQKNAVEWLRRPNPESTLELWRSIGKVGLPVLRQASGSAERTTRWNAIRLRQQLGDSEPPDLVAAYIQDLESARDCGVLRGAAERLRDARDGRALAPLRAARGKLNLLDNLCAGSALDEAIRAVSATGSAAEPSGVTRKRPE